LASPVISIAVLLLALAAVCPSLRSSPQSGSAVSGEYRIKAVYLYNFTQFVQWPESVFERHDSPLVIGVLGKDPFGASLDEVAQNETVRGRKLVIRRYSRPEEVRDCHLIFISPSQEKDLPSILELLRGTSILTVGDTQDFVSKGGMIGFISKENRIRPKINVAAARDAHLDLSSRLLAVSEMN
jgi:hypothetical protein